MVNLGLRRPLDVFLQKRRLLLGKCLQRFDRDDVVLETLVHECDVVLQDAAIGRLPIVLHGDGVKARERGLHLGSIRRHRSAPSQVVGIVQIGNHHFAQRHGAVADRLHQLIDNRNRGRLERRLPGAIKNEPSACAREQPENQRVLSEDVPLEDLQRVVIEREHRRVELQHVLGCDLGRARGRGVGEVLEVRRQLGSARR